MAQDIFIKPRMRNITLEQHIGNRLLILRKAEDTNLKELSRVIGVSYQQMQKYEKGQNRIAASTLYELAKHFKINPNFFFDNYKGDASDTDFLKQEHIVEDVQIMLEIDKINDPDMRKKVLEHLIPITNALHFYFCDEKI